MENLKNEFLRLVNIVSDLRRPKTGCPWDIEQTHQSLVPYLIEESYEVIEAIKLADDLDLIEELGDLLLQVLMHSQIASEEQRFTMEVVLKTASDKLVRRHPHVFGDLKLNSVDAVLQNWEKIKLQEGRKEVKKGILSGVPKSLPALQRADCMGSKSARIGLDWNTANEVLPKVREEVREFIESCQATAGNRVEVEAEFGDLLFSLVQYARKLGIDSENSLQGSCDKFAKRIAYIEERVKPENSEEELDRLWQEAKSQVG